VALAGITEVPQLLIAPSRAEGLPTPPGGAAPASVGFEDIFAKTVEQANEQDRAAAVKVDALARGAGDDIHGTMIAVRESEISVKLVGTIRNKLLDAFNEIWRTSV